MKSATFKVNGMHCEGCAQIITALLVRESGVQAADVSFKHGKARVVYDPQAIDEAQLVAAIEKPGYGVAGQDR